MASIQNYLGPRTKVNRFTFAQKEWVAEGISGNILYMIGKAAEEAKRSNKIKNMKHKKGLF